MSTLWESSQGVGSLPGGGRIIDVLTDVLLRYFSGLQQTLLSLHKMPSSDGSEEENAIEILRVASLQLDRAPGRDGGWGRAAGDEGTITPPGYEFGMSTDQLPANWMFFPPWVSTPVLQYVSGSIDSAPRLREGIYGALLLHQDTELYYPLDKASQQEAVRLALQLDANGEAMVAADYDSIPSLKTRPGVVILQPLFLNPQSEYFGPNNDEEQFSPAALRYPWLLMDEITLFTGQQLAGTGQGSVTYSLNYQDPYGIGRQAPFTKQEHVLWHWNALPDGNILATADGAQGVVFEAIQLAATKGSHSQKTMIHLHRTKGAVLKELILLGSAAHTVRETNARRTWSEAVQHAAQDSDGSTPMGNSAFIMNGADSTSWRSTIQDQAVLGGLNQQVVSTTVEPRILEFIGAPARVPVSGSLAEVVLDGEHCGLRHCYIEGGFNSRKVLTQVEGQAAWAHRPESYDRRRPTIQIKSGSMFSFLDIGTVTREGFSAVVEDDTMGNFIRRIAPSSHSPLRNWKGAQLLSPLSIGLTNILRNTVFNDGSGQGNWQFEYATASVRMGVRGAALRLEPNSNNPIELWQRVDPDWRIGVPRIADQTFSAGCWVKTIQPEIQISLHELSVANEPRKAGSNLHPGDGHWHFLTVALHTSNRATALEIGFTPSTGGFEIIAPIMVNGSWIPPHAPRLAFEGMQLNVPNLSESFVWELAIPRLLPYPPRDVRQAHRSALFQTSKVENSVRRSPARTLRLPGHIMQVTFTGAEEDLAGCALVLTEPTGKSRTIEAAQAPAVKGSRQSIIVLKQPLLFSRGTRLAFTYEGGESQQDLRALVSYCREI